MARPKKKGKGKKKADAFEVIDSVNEDGVKLVESTPEMMAGAGVGVVSTVPDNGYAPMSGTSMACPAVTGVLARLLAAETAVLNMARNADRSVEIKELLFARAQSLGLGITNEGKGLPK
jgi:subtilisin family serine protease